MNTASGPEALNGTLLHRMEVRRKWLMALACLTAVTVAGCAVAAAVYTLPPAISHTYLLLLQKRGAFTPTPGGLYDGYLQHGDMLIAGFLSWTAGVLRLPVDGLQYMELYHAAFRISLLAVIALAVWRALRLSRDKRPLVFCLLAGAFVSFPGTVYSFAYFIVNFTYWPLILGATSQVLFLGALVLWLVQRHRTAAAVLFLCALFHPIQALLLGVVIGGYSLYGLARRRESARGVLLTALWLLAALLPVLPDLIKAVGPKPMTPVSPDDVFRLLAYSNVRHLFPWRSNEHLAHFIAISVGVAAMFANPLLSLRPETRRRQVFAFGLTVAVCLANIGLMEMFHVVGLGGDKIIGRIFVIAEFLYALLFVGLLLCALQRRAYPVFLYMAAVYVGYLLGAFNGWSVVIVSCWLAGGSALLLWLRRREGLRLTAAGNHKAMWVWFAAGLMLRASWTAPSLFSLSRWIAALACIALIAALFGLWRTRVHALCVAGIIALGVLVAPVFAGHTAQYVRERRVQLRERAGVAAYILEHTEKDAAFLVPFSDPNLLPHVIRRDVLVNAEMWDTFSYYRSLLPGVLRAMRVIYGVDLLERARQPGDWQSQGLYRELEERHSRLDADAIARIRAEYPALKYVVFRRAGIGAQLPQSEREYADENYLLYRVDGLSAGGSP